MSQSHHVHKGEEEREREGEKERTLNHLWIENFKKRDQDTQDGKEKKKQHRDLMWSIDLSSIVMDHVLSLCDSQPCVLDLSGGR